MRTCPLNFENVSPHLPSLNAKKENETVKKIADFAKNDWFKILAGAYIGGIIGFSLGGGVGIVVGAVIGGILGPLFYKAILGAYHWMTGSNVPYLVQKSWKVEDLVTDEALQKAAERVKLTLQSLKIGEVSGYEVFETLLNDEKGSGLKEHDLDDLKGLKKRLRGGLCYGQTRAQLESISTTFGADDKTLHLIPKEHQEEVIYYQLMKNIEAGVLSLRKIQLAGAFGLRHYYQLAMQAQTLSKSLGEALVPVPGMNDAKVSQTLDIQSAVTEYKKAFKEISPESTDGIFWDGLR